MHGPMLQFKAKQLQIDLAKTLQQEVDDTRTYTKNSLLKMRTQLKGGLDLDLVAGEPVGVTCDNCLK